MKKIAFILSLLFLLPIPNLYATTLIYQSFEQIVQKAEEIFEGKVVLQESRYGNGKKTIYTYVTIAQIESIKGNNPQKTKTLRFEGGCVKDDCLTVVGMPTFEIDERVILFQKGGLTDQTICPLVGWPQGKFSVEVEEATGKEVVRDGLGHHVKGFDPQKGELVKESASQNERPVPVPILGSPDKLVSSPSPSATSQSESIPFSKEEFKAKVKELVEKHKNDQPIQSKEATQRREAVSPLGVK